jgi:hypothetical protein
MSLRKVRAQSGLDQSKTPFSQQKPVFSCSLEFHTTANTWRKPPIMVAGMTPSTIKAGFVSAVLDAGYHVELAGGGHYNAAALRSKVAEIQKLIPCRC